MQGIVMVCYKFYSMSHYKIGFTSVIPYDFKICKNKATNYHYNYHLFYGRYLKL